MDGEAPDARIRTLSAFLHEHRSRSHRVLHYLIGRGRSYLLQSDLEDAVATLSADDPDLAETVLGRTLAQCQEAAVDASWIYLALRRRVARWDHLRIHLETMDLHPVAVAEFLCFKEHLATGGLQVFEAFGLTVVEAMSCGLPSFATRYGGPLEIIEDGISGFWKYVTKLERDETNRYLQIFYGLQYRPLARGIAG